LVPWTLSPSPCTHSITTGVQQVHGLIVKGYLSQDLFFDDALTPMATKKADQRHDRRSHLHPALVAGSGFDRGSAGAQGRNRTTDTGIFSPRADLAFAEGNTGSFGR